MVEVKEILEVSITGVSAEGNGVGEYFDKEINQNYKVFIPMTAPGDIVRAKVNKVKDHVYADVYEIIKKSTKRIEPACPYFKECGGCNLMHLNYVSQLEEKQKIIENILGRATIMKKQILPIIKSEEYDFRTRARFHGELVRNNYQLGYYKEKTHKIVDLDFCMVSNPIINQVLEKFRKLLDSKIRLAKEEKKFMEEFEFEFHVYSDNEKAYLVFFAPKKYASYCEDLMLDFKSKNNTLILGYFIKNLLDKDQSVNIKENSFSYEFTDLDFKTLKYSFTPGNFTQVNLDQNEIMVALVTKWAHDFDTLYKPNYKNHIGEKEKKILDLYCGIGNFTLPLSKICTKIVGIESNTSAIENAKLNAKNNEITNTEFIANDVEREIRSMNSVKFDKIIIDPPRSGCGEAIKEIPKFKARQIIYVSCDPRSFVKDALYLIQHGYQVTKVQPFDMFPQTSHVECVTEFIGNF